MFRYVPLQACMHRAPTEENVRGSEWPDKWPRRLQTPPYWLNRSQMGIYGKPAPEDFAADYEHWKHVVGKTYLSGLGISWSDVRNIMDMRAVYGGYVSFPHSITIISIKTINNHFHQSCNRLILEKYLLQVCCCFERPQSVGYECSECRFS